jgi:hypothetical protein
MSGRLPGNKIGNHVIAVLIALAVVLMLLIFYWLASRCDTCEVGWHSTVASSSKKELSSSSDSTDMADTRGARHNPAPIIARGSAAVTPTAILHR